MIQYFNILLHIDIKNIYKQYFFNELTRIYFKIILTNEFDFKRNTTF